MKDITQNIQSKQTANAFAVYNHLELVSVEPDRVVYRLTIRPESRNPQGFVHGGALCTLADNAAGAAAHTDGRTYVTQANTMYYLANRAGGTVYATGTVLHRGRATCLARADITDEEGKLLCTGEFTFFCLSAREED